MANPEQPRWTQQHGEHTDEPFGEPDGQEERPAPPARSGRVGRTRAGGIWVAVVVALAVLAILLVFILQNLSDATVNFLGFSGTLPLAVAMLLSAVAGGLFVGLVCAARILQLRRAARRSSEIR
jgi:uncharacterized integral membrane protein